MPSAFRFQAKNVFLTYSNPQQQGSTLTMQQIFEEFTTKTWPVPLSYCVVSEENHQSGEIHFHALLRFQSKLSTTNPRLFDILGCHPNVQGARSPKATEVYVKKGGIFMETEQSSTANIHLEFLENTTDKVEWILHCIDHKISAHYMDMLWREFKVSDTATIKANIEGTMCRALQEFTYDFTKPLVLVGPTGCGKTTWAINNAPKPALLCTHLDRLRDFRPGFHKSIVFDDMSFCHLPRESQIHLTDKHLPRDIHVRYGMANIPANTIKIFTANIRPFTEDPAINRRIRVINIKE